MLFDRYEFETNQFFFFLEFGRQVLELLRYTPDYEIIFSEFIPRYHAQFGMQCRVLDYGVPKLINLFNYISDIVEVIY